MKCIQHIAKEICFCWKIKKQNLQIYDFSIKNVDTDKLDNIDKTCYSTFKIKPVDIKWSRYVDFGRKNNDKDPEFKVGENIRISKYQIIFEKGFVLNWSEEVFVIKDVKNTW